MAKEYLKAGFALPEDVRGDVLVNLCTPGGFADRFLHERFVDVMETWDARVSVCGSSGGRENVLPEPIFICIWRSAFQCTGEVDGSKAFGEVLLMSFFTC